MWSSRGVAQPVCVYALNLGPGSDVFLGCETVIITSPDPSGNFDQASA